MTKVQQNLTAQMANTAGILNNMQGLNATKNTMIDQAYEVMHAYKANFLGASLEHFDFNFEE